jgi:hypothetical protein
MAEEASNVPVDGLRVKYGFFIVLIGLLVVLTVFIIAILRLENASDATAVIGAVTGVIGTLVGTFFGIHVGSEGKEKQWLSEKMQRISPDIWLDI